VHQEDIGKTFKLRELRQQPDWHLWQKARYKMLDDYSSQDDRRKSLYTKISF
jgi:hypothetical protein